MSENSIERPLKGHKPSLRAGLRGTADDSPGVSRSAAATARLAVVPD